LRTAALECRGNATTFGNPRNENTEIKKQQKKHNRHQHNAWWWASNGWRVEAWTGVASIGLQLKEASSNNGYEAESKAFW